MKLNNRKHAFWQQTRGPENILGISLHYIQGNEEWNNALLEDAKDDPRRLERITQKIARDDESGYFYPQLGWWLSKESYNHDRPGFGGVTKSAVARDNPNLTVHASLQDAASAWRDSAEQREVTV